MAGVFERSVELQRCAYLTGMVIAGSRAGAKKGCVLLNPWTSCGIVPGRLQPRVLSQSVRRAGAAGCRSMADLRVSTLARLYTVQHPRRRRRLIILISYYVYKVLNETPSCSNAVLDSMLNNASHSLPPSQLPRSVAAVNLEVRSRLSQVSQSLF